MTATVFSTTDFADAAHLSEKRALEAGDEDHARELLALVTEEAGHRDLDTADRQVRP